MFNTIEEALNDIKQGKMIIVVDDENRENEGDLVMAADCCRPEDINFMIKNARGLVCVPIGAEQAKRLQLNPMVEHNTDARYRLHSLRRPSQRHDHRHFSRREGDNGQSSGQPALEAEDFRRPGHIFPLVARHGGVLKRAGHTEAAVDLSPHGRIQRGRSHMRDNERRR